jgi:hypothetical protein
MEPPSELLPAVNRVSDILENSIKLLDAKLRLPLSLDPIAANDKEPPLILTEPPVVALEPAEMLMSPDDPVEASPVDKLREPEDSVLMETEPLTPASLEPDDRDIEPPLEPPRIFTDPPDKSKDPASPNEEAPPEIVTEPPRETPEPSPAAIDTEPPVF